MRARPSAGGRPDIVSHLFDRAADKTLREVTASKHSV
jgi:hypothetical protein